MFAGSYKRGGDLISETVSDDNANKCLTHHRLRTNAIFRHFPGIIRKFKNHVTYSSMFHQAVDSKGDPTAFWFSNSCTTLIRG